MFRVPMIVDNIVRESFIVKYYNVVVAHEFVSFTTTPEKREGEEF